MIRTDGISHCILFIRVDEKGNPLTKTLKNKKCSQTENIEYIKKITITEKLKMKLPICIDPGFSDILYCGSRNSNNELITFRYTQNQRRLETRKNIVK